jgi:MFS family permease
MTADVSTPEPLAAAGPFFGLSQRRVSIGFLNWAHALDHFVMLVYPTVVIELQAVYGRSYSELIALSTASFIAFGLFSLPAGWLADRWSRRNMMVAFYLGCGASLIGAALAPFVGRACRRAVRARHFCRDLSSGRHRYGDRECDPSRADHGV